MSNRLSATAPGFISKVGSALKKRLASGKMRRQMLCFVLAANLVGVPMSWGKTVGLWLSGMLSQVQSYSDEAVAALDQRVSTLRQHVFVLWSGGIPFPVWIGLGAKRQLLSLEDRVAATAAVKVNPSVWVGYVGDRHPFVGSGFDTTGTMVQGLKFTWQSLDSSKLSIDEAGRATLLAPGLARVVATVGAASATASVLIRPGNRPIQNDHQWGTDQGGGSASVGVGTGGSAQAPPPKSVEPPRQSEGVLSRVFEELIPTVHADAGGGAFQSGPSSSGPWVIGTPRNGIIQGTRWGSFLPESSNFELTIPIVSSLGNRELNIPLNAYYNSQIWQQTGPTTMQFDPNQSWPCPGFSIGFGRIDTVMLPDGVTAQYTLVDPNGTRHYLGQGAADVTPPSSYATYVTSDGTYMTYIGDAVHGGILYAPSGVQYDISLINNRLLVSQVTGLNGNYIQISYMNTAYDQNGNPIPPVYSPFAISSIVDTLGRNISFAYNTTSGSGLLTSVTGPAGGVSFSYGYQQQALSYNFQNSFGQMTVQNAPASFWAITSINALNAYQFSYSQYGMIYSMTIGRTSTANVAFNYATSGSTVEAGPPAFTQWTETTGSVQGTYSYTVSNGVSTITRPDGATVALSDSNGLLAQSQISSGGKTYAKLVNTYSNDPGGSPEIVTAISYDDAGNARRVDYGYDQYTNVTSKTEYGFQVNGSWQAQRVTKVSYYTSPYTASHILNLVSAVDVYDGGNNHVASSSYSRDGYNGLTTYQGQDSIPGHLSTYDSGYTLRGNVTTATRVTNISTGASISQTAQYDVFGNEVQVQVDCCNQKNFTYGSDTYYSQPDQTTSGGSGGSTLSNNASYNFNTSAVTTTKDPNGLTTSYTSNSWLNPTQVQPPSGDSISLGYGDWQDLSSTSVSYTDGGTNKTFGTSSTKDAWGNEIQQFDPYGNQMNLSYDSMGRLVSKTNPFVKNGTPGPSTTYQRDPLGRTTMQTLPNGEMIQAVFSGSTRTVTDQVGRKSQEQRDGLGRLIQVNEQDPSTGNLTLATTYQYDILDDLVQVNQGGQIRAFKYDAIGEKLYERIPEQGATINDGTGVLVQRELECVRIGYSRELMV